MTEPFTVLLVEDNLPDARIIEEMLNEAQRESMVFDLGAADERRPVELEHVETLGDGIAALDGEAVDVVLLDINLPDSSGFETVERTLEATQRVPVVVLTGVPESELGIEAVQSGAQDYLVKDDVTADALVRAIRYAVERKQKERELRAARNKLTVLNRLMRHDVRNDLSIVVGRASQLSGHVDGAGQDVLSEILLAGNHVLQLTRSIEESVESITSTDDPELTAVDVRPVLTDEIEKVRNLYGEGDVVVEGSIPSVEVRADGLLSSAFGNLLSNAMLYNDADDPEVRIDVEVDGEKVHVSIADNGPGIAPHRSDEIFELGESGDGGTGTGLYIVDRLVDGYDGDVRVETTGVGTTFVVTLQRA